MPISSQGKRRYVDKASASQNSSQFVWRPRSASNSSENLDVRRNNNHQQQQQQQDKQRNQRKSGNTFQSVAASSKNNKRTIRQISQPTSCATTSMALNNRLADSIGLSSASDYQQPALKSPTLSLAGQLILAGKQPASLETTACEANQHLSSASVQQQQHHQHHQADNSKASLSLIHTTNHHYKFHQNHPADLYLSRSSLSQQQQPPSQASSTAQLQPNHHHQHRPIASRLSISRNMNLKYVKTLIIVLMALDLLMTILLHQFATQDQVQIWLTTYRLRFSLLNLVLSAIWFAILTAAILFDVHFVLLIACVVDVGSFVLLLVLSIVHFCKRIDYNTVQLTSLLALLFCIIFLHVYLLALSALTIYLTGAVRRRKGLKSGDN